MKTLLSLIAAAAMLIGGLPATGAVTYVMRDLGTFGGMYASASAV